MTIFVNNKNVGVIIRFFVLKGEPCSEVGKVGVSYRTDREGSGSNPGGVINFLTHG
jgi:hypothetical protein